MSTRNESIDRVHFSESSSIPAIRIERRSNVLTTFETKKSIQCPSHSLLIKRKLMDMFPAIAPESMLRLPVRAT